ncbi:MAG: type II secretion system secretin GspD [Pseudomonadota bacterium]
MHMRRRLPLYRILIASTALSACGMDTQPPGPAASLLTQQSSAPLAAPATSVERPAVRQTRASAAPVEGFVRFGQPSPNASVDAPFPIPDGDPVSINLTDASIDEIAEAVLGGLLSAPYVIEADLRGRATLRTRAPRNLRDIVDLFEDLLAAEGAALIWTGSTFRIVARNPGSPALTVAPRDTGLSRSVGYAARTVRLSSISADEMAEIIRGTLPEGAVRAVDDRRGVIEIAGSQSELTTMQDLIASFDVDWLANMSIAMIPLRRADPIRVAEELTFVAEEDGETAPSARILPLSRAQAILVVSRSAETVRIMRDLAAFLDVAGGGDGRSVFVYEAQNRAASELATLLTATFSGASAPTAAPSLAGQATLTGEEVAQIGSASEGLSVTADEGANALILRAEDEVLEQALSILERLDVTPNQVLLEVTIAEVTLSDNLRYGLEWFLRFGDFQGQFSASARAPSDLTAPETPGLSLLLSGVNGGVVLNALAALTDVDVVSTPSLMVLDNKPAELSVGDQVPIVTQSAQSVNDPGAPIVNSVSYRDTGVTLSVTPRISESGLVLLDIEQDVSDVVPTASSGIDSPTIRQRRIATTVAVTDGEALALGGLIRDSASGGESGVPVLKDVPGLGELFKTTERNRQRTELLVMITPRIVRNAIEGRRATDEMKARLVSIRPSG